MPTTTTTTTTTTNLFLAVISFTHVRRTYKFMHLLGAHINPTASPRWLPPGNDESKDLIMNA